MDTLGPTYRLHDSIGFHTTVVARLMERRVEDGLRKHGLTRTGWCILLALEEEKLTRPSEIAAFVAIDRTGASRALRQLEDAGLITRQIGSGDRRNTDVTITDKGRAVLNDAMPVCAENMQHFSGKLTQAEEAEMVRLLAKLRSGESG
jgi:DNA-binding MarR family transcriptional regulator